MITQHNNTLTISGPLTFATVTALRSLGASKMSKIASPVIDFSEVDQCDSSALALLLAWQRSAQADHKTLIFQNVPQQLLAVAELCGIKTLLFENSQDNDKS